MRKKLPPPGTEAYERMVQKLLAQLRNAFRKFDEGLQGEAQAAADMV
ncbi:MAG: hypothetical protein P8Z79_20785 [Sedimentisphaerales bacterium]